MRLRTTTVAACATLLAVTALAGCNRGSDSKAGTSGKVGIDLPRSDSDFWNSYNSYIEKGVKAGEVSALPRSNSQNDIGKLVANVTNFANQGAKAIVMAPQDTGAIASTLDTLAKKNIPVISVDTRPDKGQVYMVVRADNKAYGQKACEYLGEQLKGQGKVVEFEGALDSINGRDRSEAFASCMKTKYPNIKVIALATDWKGDVASAKLQTTLASDPDVNGIYMQAAWGVPPAHPRPPGAEAPAQAAGHGRSHHDHLQRRHPRGVQGDQGRSDRRDHLPARRPLRQVRPLLREGSPGREEVRARTHRPRLHDHHDPQRP